ncbi:MAG TPA: hypothetical protein VNX68_03885, partial [Nitrosopumilaceae archaeon]|nr:hypothetical protein [Nitrosopumilaceae archaeon]
NNMTVIEAIAFSGGLTDDGKAYRVKLVRNNGNKKPDVYLMNLSTIEGVVAGNTIVLANDIIYVEPRIRVAQRSFLELTPYLSILSSSILIYYTFLKK